MSNKSETLRLAQALNNRQECEDEAADELRRLHAENEAIHQAITDPENQPSQFGTVTFAMYEALEAQRDALLSALNAMLTHMGMDEDEWNKPTFDHARAAIAKAEGEQA